MLLFSVHPEPNGRKVDKMLTLKKVKEPVEAPVHTKRVPSPKVLLEEGLILMRKEFDHGSHLTVYQSGYVLFSAGKRNTVFHIHDCCGDYSYDAAAGRGDVIREEYFENCEWHIRALFEGERKMEESQWKCEGAGQANMVFFKAKDVDVMTAAFKEYTSETLKKQKRESVRQKLEKVKAELSNHRQLKKEKKREQEPIR